MRQYIYLNIIFAALSATLLFTACQSNKSLYDASGTFEAEEVIVSSEGDGKIISFDINEGSVLEQYQVYGLIDTVQLSLKKDQLLAGIDAALARKQDVGQQTASLKEQIKINKSERKRVQNLLDANAANQKQLDDLNSGISILEKELAAAEGQLNQANAAIDAEVTSLRAQLAQIENLMQRCQITSPINGTVLVKYAQRGELTGMGKPLFKIADVENMFLRAYVSASELAKIKLGQQVTIYISADKENKKSYPGTVSWISSVSEFTPKSIQTKDERSNLVYAVKISFANDGFAKIGMYGDVKF